MWIWNPLLPVIQSQCDVHRQIRQTGAVLCTAALKMFADALGYPGWGFVVCTCCVRTLCDAYALAGHASMMLRLCGTPHVEIPASSCFSTVLHKFTPLIGSPEMATHIELRVQGCPCTTPTWATSASCWLQCTTTFWAASRSPWRPALRIKAT